MRTKKTISSSCGYFSAIVLVFFLNIQATFAQSCPAPSFGSTTESCSGGSVTMSATSYGVSTSISSVTHRWYTASSGGSPFATIYATNVSTGVWSSQYYASLSSTTTYYVSAEFSGCSESTTRKEVKFIKKQAGNITIQTNKSPNNICAGTSITLTPSGGTNYSWIQGASGSSAITVYPTTTTTYTLSGYETICNTYKTYSLTVSVSGSSPSALTKATLVSGSLCQGGTATFTATASNAGSYQWSLSPSNVGTITNVAAPQSGGNGTISYATVSLSTSYVGSFYVNVSAIASACNGSVTSTSDPLQVVTMPGAPATAPQTVEYGTTVTLSATGALSGETYRWYDSNGALLSSNQVNTGGFTTNPTNFTVSRYNASASGCETPVAQRATSPITVYISPPPTPAFSTNTCGERTFSYSPASNLLYYLQTSESGISQSTEVTNGGTIDVSGQYYLRARAVTLPALWSPATKIPIGSTTVDAVDITSDVYSTSNPLLQATHSIRLLPGFDVPSGNTFTAKIAITSECNDFINWTEQIIYDQNEQVLTKSRDYANGSGNHLQGQSVDNLTGKVWVSQPLFDNQAQPSASTLAAPIREHDFIYKTKFVTDASGEAYGPDDFDQSIDNPAAVGTQPGTVGWYYSSNNTLEPLTPVTQYPYSRTYVPPGPNPTTSKSAAPGDEYRMGSTHEVETQKQKITTELNGYLTWRAVLVPGASATISGYIIVSTDPDEKMVATFVDAGGRTLATATFDGTTYDHWSYSYYNDLGQLIASVAPQGVAAGGATPTFVTTYQYDHLGRLIATTSPDEGTSQFVYSTDGKIRFSQNEEQRNASTKRFSYTNYDYLGRLFESGEYSESGSNPYVFEPHSVTSPATYSVLNLVDITLPADLDFESLEPGTSPTKFTGPSYKLDNVRCSDFSFIKYDRQASDFPDAATVSQKNLIGQVAKTANAHAKSWYSYDEFGNLHKTWQQINPTTPAWDVTKTVEYEYDYFGNVTEVAYQNGAADQFFHHYEYDGNQRLNKVHTSTDGTNKTVRANYYYYLHGPLKRIEYIRGSEKLQGIDYVYNLDGSLKMINHSSPNDDPGGDGISGTNAEFMKDVFGEILDYNSNDYSGADYDEGNFTLPAQYEDQFGGAVKGIRWHNQVDGHQPKAYGFTYDNLKQLDNADWGAVTGTRSTGFGFTGSTAYQENVAGYDKNGNISGLSRNGKGGSSLANYYYDYTAGTNKLSAIKAGTSSGSVLMSYQYNAIGQLKEQVEGSNTMKVSYNAYGLIKEVTDGTDALKVSYDYDDRGNRLRKTTYTTSGAIDRINYYIHDAAGNVLAIYDYAAADETPAFRLAEVPIYGAGRFAIYKPLASTVFYEVSDHLGNVRGVIGQPEPLTYVATMEDNGQATYSNPRVQELAVFKNLTETSKTDVNMNHTAPSTAVPAPENSAYLKWIDGQSGGTLTQATGPALYLKVEPGDKIDISAFAKFRKKTDGYSRNGVIGSIANVLGGNFVGTVKGLDVLSQAVAEFSEGTAALFALTGGSGTDLQKPHAYVNAIVYDRLFNVDVPATDFAPVSGNAGFETGDEATSAHEQLTIPTITITEPGYLYVYVSNESENTEVWFDDLKIIHTRSNIVAGADYYPFGLVMENREITREDYRYGYQGQFSEKDLTTGMQEFELRMYDPRIGRWLSPDPYGQFHSPYLAMGNTPQMSVDPDGGFTLGGVLPAVTITGTSYATIASIASSVLRSATTFAMFSGGCPPNCSGSGGYRLEYPSAPDGDLGGYRNDKTLPDLPKELPLPDLRSLYPSAPTIGPYKANFWGRWNASSIPGSSLTYNAINSAYVGFSTFFLKPFIGNDIYNLDNSYATSRDRVLAFTSTAAAFLPISRLQQARSVGMQAHNNFSQILQAKGWHANRAFPGSRLRPDGVSADLRFFLELKPNTMSGILKGKWQAAKYKRDLGIHGRVIYYDPTTGAILWPF